MMIKFCIKRITILVLFILVFNFLGAVPFTSMGYMRVPNAKILPANFSQISFSGYTYNENMGGDSQWNKLDEWYTSTAFTMNVGFKDWLEMGFVYNSIPKIDSINWSLSNVQKSDIVFMNLKLLLLKETNHYPAIAIGAENLFSESNISKEVKENYDKSEAFFEHDLDDYRKNSFFITFTKTFELLNKYKTEISFGGGTGRFRPPNEDKDYAKGIFLGIKSYLADNFSVFLEEDSYCINAGCNVMYKNLNFKIGVNRIDELVMCNPHPRVALSMQYTFNLFSGIADKLPESSLFYDILNQDKSSYSNISNPKLSSKLEEELIRIRNQRKNAEEDLEKLKELLDE